MNVLQLIQQKFHQALAGLVPDPAPYVAMVKPAQNPDFGDYQANCAMALARVLEGKPKARDIAQTIVDRLDLATCSKSRKSPVPDSSTSACATTGSPARCRPWPGTSGWAWQRPSRRGPMSSISARRTWPSRSTWATCGAPSSAIP